MITGQMTMGAILDLDGRLGEILLSYGLDCCNCSTMNYETLEEAAMGHGLSLEELLVVLNEAIKN